MNLLELILFVLPAYVANAAPVILGGKTPIDFGQQLGDRKRIFGKSKTIRGFISGVAAGTLASIVLAIAVPQFLPLVSFNYKIAISFLLSLGAMAGDLFGSFLKRRSGMASGQESLISDKLWFLIVALLLAFPLYSGKITLELVDVVFLFVLTFFLHIAFNRIAHFLKLKKVPW